MSAFVFYTSSAIHFGVPWGTNMTDIGLSIVFSLISYFRVKYEAFVNRVSAYE